MQKKLTLFYWLLYFQCVNWVLCWNLEEPPTDCWEECFYEGDTSDKKAYETFYNLGNFVKMHKLFNNANGTVFVLDSSVTTKSDVDQFRFLKDLIKLMSAMSPIGQHSNPFYLSQFNQDFAWYNIFFEYLLLKIRKQCFTKLFLFMKDL